MILTRKQKLKRMLLKPMCLIPTREDTVSFLCYGCTQYSCNPKYISEYIHNHYGKKYKLIWFYTNEHVKDLLPSYVEAYKKNTLQYFIALSRSKYIISNVTLPRVVTFKKNQIKINTWHGTAFKGDNNKFGNDYNRFDLFVSENELTANVLRRKDSFNFQGKILKCGMPRNDILINPPYEAIKKFKSKLKISEEYKIVIYAPTYREGENGDVFKLNISNLKNILSEKFGGKWIVIFRYHHLQKGRIRVPDSMDLTEYPDMQELLLISDVLITDYSSSMWDFSLMHKPAFIFAEDVEHYIGKERGEFYWPLNKLPFSISQSNNELSENILKFDAKKYYENISKYHSEFGRYNKDGNATTKFVSIIFK